ncbi:hypothetical protein [Acidianus sp. HS-5]|uniref:hypothetical protein n=1 Tax=Acidianus sp. HS-5 TaxID=2886040 RepID=UPI001F322C23|nr:hypothetical protein [Acidianus sp. HS-5]BDC17423.1 hypothetical protein HS5_03130 [Acidianus sp. HS-5]
MSKKDSIYISRICFLAVVLLISHLLAHYFAIKSFYLIYQHLQELGNKALLESYIQAVNEVPLNTFPSYPSMPIYFIIVLIAGISLVGLFLVINKILNLLIFKVISKIFKKINRIKFENNVIDLVSIIFFYLLVYFIFAFEITKDMLVYWPDYILLFTELILISINFFMKRLEIDVNNCSLNSQQIEYFQQFIGRLLSLFTQGIFTVSIAALVYIVLYYFYSFPTEVRKYPEFFESIDVAIILGGVYIAVLIRNLYRLARLEYNIISRSPENRKKTENSSNLK